VTGFQLVFMAKSQARMPMPPVASPRVYADLQFKVRKNIREAFPSRRRTAAIANGGVPELFMPFTGVEIENISKQMCRPHFLV
jgi:hypothetical protein